MTLDKLLKLARKHGLEEDLLVSIARRYERYLEGEEFANIRILQELTGINPEFSEGLVQEAYEKIILAGNYDRLETLEEVTGMKLTRKTVQEVYVAHIKSGDLEALEALKEFSKIPLSAATNKLLTEKIIATDKPPPRIRSWSRYDSPHDAHMERIRADYEFREAMRGENYD